MHKPHNVLCMQGIAYNGLKMLRYHVVSLLTLGVLDVSILAMLPVNGLYSKQHQNQSDKPDRDETKDQHFV